MWHMYHFACAHGNSYFCQMVQVSWSTCTGIFMDLITELTLIPFGVGSVFHYNNR